jgi:polyisoprenoid-binding protein YceI
VTELGPANAKLTVHTARAGVAARAGHDLVIEVTRWSASLELDRDAPERTSLTATVDATSLEVVDGVGGMKPLTDSDRSEIKKNMASKVLQTDRNPQITFASTSATPAGAGRLTIAGDLTLVGVTRPVQLAVELDGDGGRVTATAKIDQTEFGIRPYTALMGALKVAPEVEVRAEATLP